MRSYSRHRVRRAMVSVVPPTGTLRFEVPDILATIQEIGGPQRDIQHLVMLAETPLRGGMPLAHAMGPISRWLAQVTGDTYLQSTRIFLVDALGGVDTWRAGSIEPVGREIYPQRSIDAATAGDPDVLNLWLEHVATVDEHVAALEDAFAAPLEGLDLGPACLPMLGIGATVVQGKALYAATVHRLMHGGTVVGVRRDLVNHASVLPGGARARQFIAHPLEPMEWYRRTENGTWVDTAGSLILLHIGARNTADGELSEVA